MQFVAPARLRPGDTVAVLSLCSGSAERFPRVFDHGLHNLAKGLGLKIREYPSTRAPSAILAAHPEVRARDLVLALEDPEVAAVISSIGGDDSVLVLEHLEPEILRRHAKIVMGYSDFTTYLTYLHQAGVVTYHGPQVMAGFAQMDTMGRAWRGHLRAMLFEPKARYTLPAFRAYSDGYLDWSVPANLGQVKPPRRDEGGRTLQGRGPARGRLFGGCIEVLEFLKGTRFFPSASFFDDTILFLETSEETPSPISVHRWLRNYGSSGILARIRALLLGRCRNYDAKQKRELERRVLSVVRDEFHFPDLPVVANLPFGHTDPQWVLPLGVKAEVILEGPTVRLLAPPVN
jgi:muramoyltetrapeptide carboxypeptidase LdcA involved in peptidoglycan recycling